MLIRKKNNKGFTLVEVIVSMLVLSIMIVSVLSAFTSAAKSNTRTKKIQGAESLLENLLEYTKANAKEFDPEKGMDELGLYLDLFITGGSSRVTTAFSDTNDVEVSEITGVKEGMYEYTVRITRDRNPAAYATGSMNEHKVITFGESSGGTVVINANVTEYDTNALELFLAMHKEEVDRHNLAEAERAAAEPGYTADSRSELTEEEMKNILMRELWLETSKPQPNKVQLKASMVYSVPDSLMLPDGAERQTETEFFASEEFELSVGGPDTGKKLKQIYVLYSPSSTAKGLSESDVRILDKAGQLDANIFLAYQKSGLESLDDAVTKSLAGRYNSSDRVKVSFRESVNSYEPVKLGVYCSAGLTVDAKPSTVTTVANSLVAGDTAYRVVAINIEVIDPQTGQVLTKTKDAIACLQ